MVLHCVPELCCVCVQTDWSCLRHSHQHSFSHRRRAQPLHKGTPVTLVRCCSGYNRAAQRSINLSTELVRINTVPLNAFVVV